MSEIRKDPLIERWVVIAPERAARPDAMNTDPGFDSAAEDPFLEGNEHLSPPEVLAYRDAGTQPNSPGWRVRVVPNLFPAFSLTDELRKQTDGLYEQMTGVGVHEVIVECPHAEWNMSRFPTETIREVLLAYRERLFDLKQNEQLLHALIFKNKGALAGASLPHCHSQLMATPFVPIALQDEIAAALTWYNTHQQQSVYEAILQQELAADSRLIHETDLFIAFTPYASRFAYEVMILPKQQQSHYEQITKEELFDLSPLLKLILQKLECALNDPPYNYVIQTAPLQDDSLPHFRWHLSITPRLTRIAGYEWGSGCFINPLAPETAAEVLRNVTISD